MILGFAVAGPGAAARTPMRAAAAQPSVASLDVNVALTGSPSSDSAEGGATALNAVDGSASTEWCPLGSSGILTLDLLSLRSLDGLGFTLSQAGSNTQIALSVASRADQWHPVTGPRRAARVGTAEYAPLSPQLSRTRYVRLSVANPSGRGTVCVGELRAFAAVAGAVPQRGADLSFEPQEEAAGARYTDRGRPGTALQILRSHGLNYVRLRLWVNPPAGYSDLATDLAMARRVKAAGAKLYLDIHYSDFWADPQHQIIPAAWQGQSLSQLAATVRRYTSRTLAAFAAQGTPVDMVSIGNEIRNGLLWPLGQVDYATNTGWAALGRLLKAGVAGARAGAPAAHQPRIMLHFDQGGDNGLSRDFFDHLTAERVPFDVIGLSYYPFWHGPVESLRFNVNDLAARYGKDIVIAETQYPWTLANGDSLGNSVWEESQLAAGYPATSGGQLSLDNDLLSILTQVPAGRGLGLFYWEPEWIPGVGWEPGAGSPNDNLTLFDFAGHALASVGLFQNPVAVCQRYGSRVGGLCTIPTG